MNVVTVTVKGNQEKEMVEHELKFVPGPWKDPVGHHLPTIQWMLEDVVAHCQKEKLDG